LADSGNVSLKGLRYRVDAYRPRTPGKDAEDTDMASHDDTRFVGQRAKRQFRPIVESTLERREVMTGAVVPVDEVPDATAYVAAESPIATPANSTPDQTLTDPAPIDYGDIATTGVGTPTPTAYEIATTGMPRAGSRPGAAVTDWSSMAGWSWLGGVWKSNTKIDFMDTLARSMGAKSARFPSIPSMDTWLTETDRYIGRTAIGAQQQASMPLDGLVIKPGGTTGTTTLSMTSADGTPPVELPLTSTNRNTATFSGSTPIFDSTTNESGQEVTTTSTGAPVRVNLVKRNANSMRITAEMLTGGKWTRMFTYTATKSRPAKA
jgi:hypothetical protein